jgi:hypothetical protein
LNRLQPKLPEREQHRRAIDRRKPERRDDVAAERERRAADVGEVGHLVGDARKSDGDDHRRGAQDEAEDDRVPKEAHIGAIDVADAQLRADCQRTKSQSRQPPAHHDRLEYGIEQRAHDGGQREHQPREGERRA